MAKRDKLMCQTCTNQVNGVYCTRRMEMAIESHIYKKCIGYKVYVAPPPKVEPVKVKKELDYESMGTFGKFLKNGGHYSFRTGEFKGINEVPNEKN